MIEYYDNDREKLKNVAKMLRDPDLDIERIEEILSDIIPASRLGLQEIGSILGFDVEKFRSGVRLDIKMRVESAIQKESPGFSKQIPYQQINDVIVPPNTGRIIQRGSGGFEYPGGIPRTQMLLDIISGDLGVRLSECQMIEGTNRPEMVRSASYRIIVIPVLHKMIFVCDEEHNRTFIIDGSDPKTYIMMTKDQLRMHPSVDAVRWNDNAEEWRSQVMELLQKKNLPEDPSSPTISNTDELKRIFVGRYTPDTWIELMPKKARELNIEGITIENIENLLGIKSDPRLSAKVIIQIGKKIFGEEAVEQALRSRKEKWRNSICQLHKPEKWLKLGNKERKKLKVVYGDTQKGLHALATIFDIPGDPVEDYDCFILLSKHIFSENTIETILETTKQKCIEAVKKRFSCEDWLALSTYSRKSLIIQCEEDSLTIFAIADLLGVSGNARDDWNIFVALSQKIYGNVLVAELLAAKENRKDAQVWIEAVKESYSVLDWLEMNAEEKREFKISIKNESKTLAQIASLLHIAGNPRDNEDDFHRLGKRIFGEAEFTGIVDSYADLWKKEIQDWYDPITWILLTAKEKYAIRIKMNRREKSLAKIAILFGISGDPCGNHGIHIILGEKIYGYEEIGKANSTIKEILLPQNLANIVKSMLTPEHWVNIPATEIKKLKFPIIGNKQFGLKQLGTLFGIHGNPADNLELYYELGRRIYSTDLDRALEHRTNFRRSPKKKQASTG